MTCGVTVTGDAFCWGLDRAGTLGAVAPEQCDLSDPSGGRPCSTRPQLVAGGHRFKSVSAGGEHVCGLVESGDVYCWGSNVTGTLGNGTRTPSSTPIRVNAGPYTAVSAGLRHTCALTAGGEVDCWGDAGAGQLGVPIETLCPGSVGICGTVPVRVATTQRFAAVHAGFDATCALTSVGEVWCWGSNNFGHLGDGTTRGRATPAPVAGTHRFRSLNVGVASVCGVTTDGVGYCWGSNIGGVLGIGSETESRVPVPVSGGLTFSDISVSRGNTIFTLACGLTQSGAAHCWGSNFDGALGVETVGDRCYPSLVLPEPQLACSKTPVAVSGGLHFSAITTGFSSACGISFEGTAYCWGSNRYGALGNGTTVASSTPVQVAVP
jgi:alpha-tubulin suppressor-like RCC1 family protein